MALSPYQTHENLPSGSKATSGGHTDKDTRKTERHIERQTHKLVV
jgi:hypothetical protein